MSPGKVMIINRVLEDLLTFLSDEPSGKYLDVLDDQTLPQTSDAVLMMVQFESALASFNQRYHKSVGSRYYWMGNTHYWITKEQIAKWEEEKEERLANDEEEEEEEEDGG
ncbi:MAG: hypothetical protein IIA72_07460 [Proteobacteria bacterium]|nr:hypothetical protein [Pseudomonadota bacterium]